MKYLRVCLLVLLTALLPIRGAVAATMPCADGPSHELVAAAAGAAHDHHVHADTQASHDADDGAGTASTTDCHLCASGCHATPVAASAPTVAEPLLSDQLDFPALHAPVPSFVSEGPERPPRSC